MEQRGGEAKQDKQGKRKKKRAKKKREGQEVFLEVFARGKVVRINGIVVWQFRSQTGNCGLSTDKCSV